MLDGSKSIILEEGWLYDVVVEKYCSGQCRGDKTPQIPVRWFGTLLGNALRHMLFACLRTNIH
jgi:hypothetical protein